MQSEKRNILMHCSAGVSRSGSFTIAFFMRDKGWPFEKAK
jgi:protein-tyrosine phosphatase